MGKKLLIGGAILLLAGGGVAANLKWRKPPAVEIQAETVARRDLTAIVSGSGKIRPYKEVDISSNVMGRITELAVVEGQEVVENSLLLEIDPVPFQSAVEQMNASIASARTQLHLAEEDLAYARQNLDRVEGLFRQDLASRQAYDQALLNATSKERAVQLREQDWSRLEAQMVRARHDLSKVTLTAPIAGVITSLNVEEGETVVTGTMNNAGTVLLTIADLSVVEAEIEIDETDIVSVVLGQAAEVRIDAFPDRVLAAVVTEVGKSPIRTPGAATGQAINFKAVVRLTDPLPGARPGLSCTADVTTATRSSAVAVPIQALLLREVEVDAEGNVIEFDPAATQNGVDSEKSSNDADEEERVTEEREGAFVLRDGRAVFVAIDIGIAGDRHFEVLSGIAEGDQVITGPFDVVRTLQDGDRVEVDEGS